MSRQSIAVRVGILWLLGLAGAMVVARYPGYWHDPRVPFNYPWSQVAFITLQISLEAIALFVILAWLPLKSYWVRTTIAAGISFLALNWYVMNGVTDQPGWYYANSGFIGSVFLLLVIDLMVAGIRALVQWFRRASPDAA